MHAVKAIFQNGAVRFVQEPPYKGTFEILIIFPDLGSDEAEFTKKLYFQGTTEMDKIMNAEPEWKPEQFIERKNQANAFSKKPSILTRFQKELIILT